MRKFSCFILGLLFGYYLPAQTTSLNAVIQLKIEARENPPSLIFSWKPDVSTSTYNIYKKAKGAGSWGSTFQTVSGGDSTFTDTAVKVGEAWEYRIDRIKSANITAIGYAYSGIKFPAADFMGTVVLLVDSAYVDVLAPEIARLEEDLVGEGWRIIRHNISRNDSIPLIKQLIVNDKMADPAVRTVFILGRIPVPWSGNFTVPPDGHVVGSGSHTDAWPADVYYADLDGNWTDWMINSSTAARPIAFNIPGDGKFDQTSLPSAVDVELGRVDLFNMPAFSSDDTLLVKKYLNKNHQFRTGQVPFQRKSVVDDNFTSLTIAAAGWMNFAHFFGPQNVRSADYFTSIATDTLLYSFGCGAGSFTSCSGVGNYSDFKSKPANTIFTMLAGSYFGDWDNANNLLRAPLASEPTAIACCWGGIPHWFLQHMAMGENIGFGTKLTQNNLNDYPFYNFNSSMQKVHIALMGDPTLRLFPVKPVANVRADSLAHESIMVRWSPSPDTNIIGYNIFRAGSMDGDFKKLNEVLLTDTFYHDSRPRSGNNLYQVRAVKYEVSGSGSFLNQSRGMFASASTTSFYSLPGLELVPEIRVFPNPCTGVIYLLVKYENSDLSRVSVFNSQGQEVTAGLMGANQVTSFNLNEFGKGLYIIRIQTDQHVNYHKVLVR